MTEMRMSVLKKNVEPSLSKDFIFCEINLYVEQKPVKRVMNSFQVRFDLREISFPELDLD